MLFFLSLLLHFLLVLDDNNNEDGTDYTGTANEEKRERNGIAIVSVEGK